MGRDRTVVAVVSILLLSTSLFVIGAANIFFSDGGSLKGEWQLTFVKGYENGEYMSADCFDTPMIFFVDNDDDGIIEGTFDGEPFIGSVSGNVIRFKLSDDDGFSQMIGYENVPGILIISVVSYNMNITGSNDDELGAYSMLFTRDGVTPHLIDFLALNITGEWISNYEETDIKMNITDQKVSVAQGIMNYDGTDIKFVASVSMLQNESMNWGMILDANGELWVTSAKKGLMILYHTEIPDPDVPENVGFAAVYMVRDRGDTIVPVPRSLNGTIWTATEGSDAHREIFNVNGSMRIIEQNDCVIYGEMLLNGITYKFAGAFVTGTLPLIQNVALAEISFNAGNKEIRAMMIVNQDMIQVVTFDGEFTDAMVSIKFMRG